MVPITDIIARNQNAVERILGPAEKKEMVVVNGPKACLKAHYYRGEIQIIYFDNVADWITIYNKEKRNMTEFILHFGLTDFTLFLSQRGSVSHTDVLGLQEISSYTRKGIPERVHIKVFKY